MINAPQFDTLADMESSMWLTKTQEKMARDEWPAECVRCQETEPESIRQYAIKLKDQTLYVSDYKVDNDFIKLPIVDGKVASASIPNKYLANAGLKPSSRYLITKIDDSGDIKSYKLTHDSDILGTDDKQRQNRPLFQVQYTGRNNQSESITEDLDAQFDLIESWVEQLAEKHGVDAEVIWEDFEDLDDDDLLSESAAWQKKSGKNKNGGLNAKGVASYRREHPGSKLQTAVTTKPSKLKKGSKAAKRRKSFCARMGGMKGAMKDDNGKPTRKALALRKWNC
jgi:hypothetical protein